MIKVLAKKLSTITSEITLGLLILMSSSALDAQSATGQITGTVKDTTGAVVSQAEVKVGSEQTGLSRKVNTSEAGLYSFPLLPVGVYSITVTQKGFSSAK